MLSPNLIINEQLYSLYKKFLAKLNPDELNEIISRTEVRVGATATSSTNQITGGLDSSSNQITGGELKDINIYELLHPEKFDPYTISKRRLILSYYQIIPKYYLLSSDEINTLIYNARTGSGKSISGLLLLLSKFNDIQTYNFNRNFFLSNNSQRVNEESANEISSNMESIIGKIKKNIGNIYVVSVWSGIDQIINEFFRPEFGYVDEKTRNKLNSIYSPVPERREEAIALKQSFINKLKKLINFHGYQSFFNYLLSEEIAEKNIAQDVDALLQAYTAGNINVKPNIREELRNSIIVVDEMQKLYSSDGMNTYGFAIMVVSKLAKELNIKIMLMSGTVFNNSPKEIVDVLNIINPNKQIIPYEEYLETTELLDGVVNYKLQQNKIPEIINYYKNQFIYYNPMSGQGDKQFKIVKIESLPYYIYHDENNQNAIIFDKLPNLPQEIYVGSTVISDKNDVVPFMTYTCLTTGEQSKEYKEYVKNYLSRNNLKNGITEIEDIDEDDNHNTISIRDAYIPKKDRMQHGIIESSGIFIGKFLKLENIKKYSTIAYNLTKLVMENAFHAEKTVVYHNKLRNFGIYQYCKILEANGCVELGNTPRDESLCKNCRNDLRTHNLPISEKLAKRCCNNFTPIVFAILTGNATESERAEIKQMYNAYNNTYGNIISCIFVSNVAYSGVSFLNTNNIAMISPISDISKWKQIAARIVRTKSHAVLAKEKQIAKIYTFVVNLPDELEQFPKLNKFTLSERYYAINIKQNNIIDGFVNRLAESCIGNTLFNNPRDLKISSAEQRKLSNLFITDVQNNLELVIDRIFVNEVSKIWVYDTFVKRLMDDEYTTYFFMLSGLSPDLIRNILLTIPSLRIFYYDLPRESNKSDKKLYIEIRENKVNEIEPLSTFNFSAIEETLSDPKSLLKLMETLSSAKDFVQKTKVIQQIMKYVGKRFNLLAEHDVFWKSMYEIHNEHYPDDDTNFFRNHSSNERNISKIDGCYFGDFIIFRDGTNKLMDYTFPNNIKPFDGIPYLFRITCRANTSSSPFYLNLVVIEKNDDTIVDGRKLIKGISCISYKNMNKLLKYFPEISGKSKKLICRELMDVIIDRQAKSNVHAVYSPYEK